MKQTIICALPISSKESSFELGEGENPALSKLTHIREVFVASHKDISPGHSSQLQQIIVFRVTTASRNGSQMIIRGTGAKERKQSLTGFGCEIMLELRTGSNGHNLLF